MEKTRVSIVSYLNSRPFLYGIRRSPIAKQIDLSLDIPAKVASKLAFNIADIGLIPVAGLEDMASYSLIGDYCIGAVEKVKTVVLVSDVPIEKIKTVLMDYQSRSSVLLSKVLAKFHWKKQFDWQNTCNDFQNKSIGGTTAGVLIGDRVFDVENRFRYCYDLSEEWYKLSGLPFVFAVWAANKEISRRFEQDFNKALAFGIENISDVVRMEQSNYPTVNIDAYFSDCISFELDGQKRKGMKLFLDLAQKLQLIVQE